MCRAYKRYLRYGGDDIAGYVPSVKSIHLHNMHTRLHSFHLSPAVGSFREIAFGLPGYNTGCSRQPHGESTGRNGAVCLTNTKTLAVTNNKIGCWLVHSVKPTARCMWHA